VSEWIIGLSIASFAFSLVTLPISMLALAYIVGLKNSTHRIQYVDPTNPTGDDLAKEIEQSLKKIDEDISHT